jgi:RNA polymerase sigma-70 factor (ECF subfamily)
MKIDMLTAEFIRNIKHGDVDSFEQLFRSNFQGLVSFTNRFVRDIDIAENLAQDIFVDVWRNRHRINPDLNFKVYLYKAAKNKALNYLKKLKAECNLLIQMELPSGSSPTPHDKFREQEIQSSIAKAIESLPEKCRLIFTMNRFDGLTYAEIADVLKISIKTVETQMGRALKYLRQRLAHLLALAVNHMLV